MKSSLYLLSLGIAALTASPTPSYADDHADIIALYAKLQQAMKAQSPEQTLALLAPDFTHEDLKGHMQNGKQFTDQIKVQKSEVTVKDMKLKVTNTVIKGSKAQVKNEFSWTMDVVDRDGQSGPKGMHHTMASTGVVENDLVKTPQGWRFKTLNTVNGKLTLDGKPMERRPPKSPPQGGK